MHIGGLLHMLKLMRRWCFNDGSFAEWNISISVTHFLGGHIGCLQWCHESPERLNVIVVLSDENWICLHLPLCISQ